MVNGDQEGTGSPGVILAHVVGALADSQLGS